MISEQLLERITIDPAVCHAQPCIRGQFGHDAHSVHDEDLAGTTDVELLQVYRTEGRMLVTFDIGFGDLRAHRLGAIPEWCCSASLISNQERR